VHGSTIIWLLIVFAYPILLLILIIADGLSKPQDGSQVDEKLPSFAAPRIGKKYEQWKKYMKSSAWKNFKRRVYKARGNQCERCKTTQGVKHVHHLTYERLGAEELTDVAILCEECHDWVHRRKR